MGTGTISYWVLAMIKNVSFISCTNHCYVVIDHIKHVVPFFILWTVRSQYFAHAGARRCARSR